MANGGRDWAFEGSGVTIKFLEVGKEARTMTRAQDMLNAINALPSVKGESGRAFFHYMGGIKKVGTDACFYFADKTAKIDGMDWNQVPHLVKEIQGMAMGGTAFSVHYEKTRVGTTSTGKKNMRPMVVVRVGPKAETYTK